MHRTLALLLAAAALATGCEPDAADALTADTPELRQAMVEHAAALESTFGVAVGRVHGRIAAQWGYRERGYIFFCPANNDWAAGIWIESARAFVVSSRWHPAIVRHELLHAAGYLTHPATINGVRVSDHVERWRD